MPRTLGLDVDANSPERIEVGPEDSAAMDLTEMLLETRRVHLKRRRPRSKRVRILRSKIQGGVAKPFHMLLAVGDEDIGDGAPLTAVLRPWYAGIAVLRARAARRATLKGVTWDVRMNAAMLRGIRAATRVSEAQFRLANTTGDMAAVMALGVALRDCKSIYEEMETLIDERCAVDRLVA